jgi:hypothetical protein
VARPGPCDRWWSADGDAAGGDGEGDLGGVGVGVGCVLAGGAGEVVAVFHSACRSPGWRNLYRGSDSRIVPAPVGALGQRGSGSKPSGRLGSKPPGPGGAEGRRRFRHRRRDRRPVTMRTASKTAGPTGATQASTTQSSGSPAMAHAPSRTHQWRWCTHGDRNRQRIGERRGSRDCLSGARAPVSRRRRITNPSVTASGNSRDIPRMSRAGLRASKTFQGDQSSRPSSYTTFSRRPGRRARSRRPV